MTTKTIYRQCGLVRDLGNDVLASQVSFIPAKFAKKNVVVKLKDDNGEWEDGWKVVTVGVGADNSNLPDSHKAIKAHRRRTGDSLKR
jgi:hypothetical protein